MINVNSGFSRLKSNNQSQNNNLRFGNQQGFSVSVNKNIQKESAQKSEITFTGRNPLGLFESMAEILGREPGLLELSMARDAKCGIKGGIEAGRDALLSLESGLNGSGLLGTGRKKLSSRDVMQMSKLPNLDNTYSGMQVQHALDEIEKQTGQDSILRQIIAQNPDPRGGVNQIGKMKAAEHIKNLEEKNRVTQEAARKAQSHLSKGANSDLAGHSSDMHDPITDTASHAGEHVSTVGEQVHGHATEHAPESVFGQISEYCHEFLHNLGIGDTIAEHPAGAAGTIIEEATGAAIEKGAHVAGEHSDTLHEFGTHVAGEHTDTILEILEHAIEKLSDIF